MSLDKLRVKIFADGAELNEMQALAGNRLIRGFTTNPTLMRKAGVSDYEGFARQVLGAIGDRPISFEVFADEFDEMEQQALAIAGWGGQVNVKIPVTNTRGASSGALVRRLARAGVRLNVTALMTLGQVAEMADCLAEGPGGFVSVFAGRVADTGRDPVPLMREAVRLLESNPRLELIWASPREVLNIFEADAIGCQVITVTADLLKKLSLFQKPLDQYSLETVQMFYRDAQAAGFRIGQTARV